MKVLAGPKRGPWMHAGTALAVAVLLFVVDAVLKLVMGPNSPVQIPAEMKPVVYAVAGFVTSWLRNRPTGDGG